MNTNPRRLLWFAARVAPVLALAALFGTVSFVPVAGSTPQPGANVDPALYGGLRYRMVGPHRGGSVTAVAGHRRQLSTFYMGATGGGVWKTTDNGQYVGERLGRLLRNSIHRCHRRRRVESRHRLRRHRERRHPQQHHHRPRRLQVGGRRKDVELHRTSRHRRNRVLEDSPRQSGCRLCRGRRADLRAECRARRVSDEGRGPDLGEGSLHQRPDRAPSPWP
jgi:hypothetical protein